MAKIAIIVYSTYGHLYNLAKEVKAGVESAGGVADLFRVPETLSQEILDKMHAPAADADFKIADLETLKEYDAFLFGVPTRFGNMPAQWTSFWGAAGSLWANGALYHKPAGVFVSTSTPGGGQEVTVRNYMSIIAHFGMIYVPLGYGKAFAQLTSFDEIHGGSPWGAGMFAGADGSRQASALEKEIAGIQGGEFASILSQKFGFEFSKEKSTDATTTTATAAVAAAPTEAKEAEKKAVSEKETKAGKARKDQSTKEKKKDIAASCSKCVIV